VTSRPVNHVFGRLSNVRGRGKLDVDHGLYIDIKPLAIRWGIACGGSQLKLYKTPAVVASCSL